MISRPLHIVSTRRAPDGASQSLPPTQLPQHSQPQQNPQTCQPRPPPPPPPQQQQLQTLHKAPVLSSRPGTLGRGATRQQAFQNPQPLSMLPPADVPVDQLSG